MPDKQPQPPAAEMTPAAQRLKVIKDETQVLEAETREIYRASFESTDPTEKVCDDFMAQMLMEDPPDCFIKYPITVRGIDTNGAAPVHAWRPTERMPTQWVMVRPCADRFEGKTLLGVYLGRAALATGAQYSKDGLLRIGAAEHNPMIWVPDCGEIVYGCGSWWGPISEPDDLRQISTLDIQSVWYVRLIEAMVTGDRFDTIPDMIAGNDALEAFHAHQGSGDWTPEDYAAEHPDLCVESLARDLDLPPPNGRWMGDHCPCKGCRLRRAQED